MKIMSSIWSQPEVDWNLNIKWTVDRGGETIIWYSLFFKHTVYHHTVLKMKAITLLLILLLTMTNIQANYLFDLELAGEYRIESQNFICSKYYSLKYYTILFITLFLHYSSFYSVPAPIIKIWIDMEGHQKNV